MPILAVPGFSAGKLIEAREAEGWRREDLASASGLSYFTIEAYERGLKHPSPTSLMKVAHALGIRPADLLDDGTGDAA